MKLRVTPLSGLYSKMRISVYLRLESASMALGRTSRELKVCCLRARAEPTNCPRRYHFLEAVVRNIKNQITEMAIRVACGYILWAMEAQPSLANPQVSAELAQVTNSKLP